MTDKQRFSRIGFCYFALMLLTQLLAAVAQIALYAFIPAWLSESGWMTWLASYVPLYAVAVPVFFWMMHRLVPDGGAQPGKDRFSAGRWVRVVVLIFGLMYLCNYASLLLTWAFTGQLANALDMAVSGSGWLPNLVFGVIIAPIGEEFLFRWMLWRKMGQYGDKAYILLGGVIFALFHGNLSQLLYAFFIGAIFCWVYARTGKLAYTIALHIGINAVGILLAPLALQNQVALVALGVFILASIAGAGIILALYAKRTPYAPPRMEDAPAHPVRRALTAPGMLFYTALCLALVVYVLVVIRLG